MLLGLSTALLFQISDIFLSVHFLILLLLTLVNIEPWRSIFTYFFLCIHKSDKSFRIIQKLPVMHT